MVKSSKDVKSFKDRIASALKNKNQKNGKKIVVKKTVKKDLKKQAKTIQKRPAKKHKKHTIAKPIQKAELKPRPVKHHKKHIEYNNHKVKHPQHHDSKVHHSINKIHHKHASPNAHHNNNVQVHHTQHQNNSIQSAKAPIAMSAGASAHHSSHKHPSHQEHHKSHHLQNKYIANNSKAMSVEDNQLDPESRVIVKERKTPNSAWNFKTDKDIAMDFATKVHRNFDHLIKATILFGSQTTGNIKPGSDIDMVIIIDDAAINWDLELTSWYREELGKIRTAQNYGRDLHIKTL